MFIDLGEVVLRKPEQEDLEAIHQYRNDPDVYSTLGGHYAGMSREDVRRWIEHHRTNQRDLVLVLADKADDTCVGHAGLYNIDYRRGKAELGIAIARTFWGKGLGVAVYVGLIEYAFKQLRLHRLETFNLEKNKKIVRVKEKLGFTLEGVLRDYEFRDGQWLNVMCMTILSTEWQGYQAGSAS